ncbi:MAG: glycerol-3-phosphate 1-O-acyltransferase PlsY [Phycisphaerae bacterium]|nr:glycerol-3-phosphate 1-O-acyltransferase PlsY [Phycisphaerae bacterium]
MSTTEVITVVGLIIAAYLLGAVPFGLMIGLTRGVDVRRAGSGNIGATNVVRVLGWRLGGLAFVCDILKGFVPMVMAPWFLRSAGLVPGNAASEATGFYSLWLIVGAAAILGHVFPVYLKLRGGKGVATSLGVVLGLWPYYTIPGLICFAMWGVVFFVGRYVSLASIAAAVGFPVTYLLLARLRGWGPWTHQRPLLIFAVVIALLVVYRHRSNIQRLLAGQEHRFGSRS